MYVNLCYKLIYQKVLDKIVEVVYLPFELAQLVLLYGKK